MTGSPRHQLWNKFWWSDWSMGSFCSGYQSVDTGILNRGLLDPHCTNTGTRGPAKLGEIVLCD